MRKGHVHEHEERVEAVHHVDEGVAEAADDNLTNQQQEGQDQHAPV